MLESRLFSEFFTAIANDPRIGSTHISIYMALLQYWKEHQYATPFYVFSRDIMRIAKVSASATYHKTIWDLNNFGYIRYEPSFKRNQGSKIHIYC